MKNTALSSRYAKAYIDLATERVQLPAAISASHCIIETLDKHPEIEVLLNSPLESVQGKLYASQKAFQGIKEQIAQDFVQLIITKGRSGYLRDIMQQTLELYQTIQGIVKADVYCASQLSDQQVETIKSKLKASTSASTIELRQHIDSSLIGGFKITLGDKVWDSTISGRLEDIKKKYS